MRPCACRVMPCGETRSSRRISSQEMRKERGKLPEERGSQRQGGDQARARMVGYEVRGTTHRMGTRRTAQRRGPAPPPLRRARDWSHSQPSVGAKSGAGGAQSGGKRAALEDGARVRDAKPGVFCAGDACQSWSGGTWMWGRAEEERGQGKVGCGDPFCSLPRAATCSMTWT